MGLELDFSRASSLVFLSGPVGLEVAVGISFLTFQILSVRYSWWGSAGLCCMMKLALSSLGKTKVFLFDVCIAQYTVQPMIIQLSVSAEQQTTGLF